MAAIDLDEVQKDLERRFAAAKPDFYSRRIIFWRDEAGEFKELIGGLRLEGVKIVKLTGSNTFAVKKLLCHDDTESDYLVYDPRSFSKDDDNWLINIQLYSEEFRADLNSIWMNEMELPAELRGTVKKYGKFFQAKERRERVKKLSGSIKKPSDLHLAVMAAICGCGELKPNNIVRSVLEAGLKTDENRVYGDFKKYGAVEAFWNMSARAVGYIGIGGDGTNLKDLAFHILLTAASQSVPLLMQNDVLKDLISVNHQSRCYDIVDEWLHGNNGKKIRQYKEIARFAEEEFGLSERFSELNIEDIAETEVFPCIDECILSALMQQISDNNIQADLIKNMAEKRRSKIWYSESISPYYEGLLQAANMKLFKDKHAAGFHTMEAHRLWNDYTSDYYKMDSFYRRFHLCCQKVLKFHSPSLNDLFQNVKDRIEGLYSRWFLEELGENWIKAAEDELRQNGRISEVPQQENIYRDRVAGCDSRVFVVISDAFRYEAAAELCEQLRLEMQCKVTLNSVQAIFPTVTKFGMAALLPHRKLAISENDRGVLSVLADGQSTESGYRDKVLKAANSKSVALKYLDIINKKSAERSALVKGMDVVYIYHDTVDEAGHISDSAVFSACSDAIDEIKNLVRIIVNDLYGVNILITADHGFLYTSEPLKEDAKVDKTTPSSQDVETDRRYLIARAGAKPNNLLPVKFIGTEAGYEAWTPRGRMCIKKKGSGLNFVHGGVSLQEMAVPVIEFKHLRSDSSAYKQNRDKIDTKPAALVLLSTGHKISNMIFALDFYQKEAVGGNCKAATYSLYFTDAEGKIISDKQKITADRTEPEEKKRIFRCKFSLRSQSYRSSDSYYLVIVDEENKRKPPVREEFCIDIAFAADEFDFFKGDLGR